MAGGPIFVQTSTPRERPLSLLEVIARIQQFAAIEQHGTRLPVEYLTVVERSRIIWTGLKGGVGGMALGLVLLPLNVGVLDRIVPVFGGGPSSPLAAAFDTLWALILPFAWPVGYLYFMVRALTPCGIGRVPSAMIRWLYGGFTVGLILITTLVLLAYHWCLLVVTPEALAAWCYQWWRWVTIVVSPMTLRWIMDAYHQFYPAWLQVIGLALSSLVVMLVVPPLCFAWGQRRARQQAAWYAQYDDRSMPDA
jgi:hypothetical protein